MAAKRLVSAPALAAFLAAATIPLAGFHVNAAGVPTNETLTGLVTAWNLVPHPASLEGSLMGTRTTTDSRGSPWPAVSYRLNCAAAASPDNDACRAASIYPVDVVMGVRELGTASSAGTTTVWSCRIADDAFPGAPLTASCVNTLASAGGSTTVTTSMDECAVNARMVLANITAGWENIASTDLPEKIRHGDSNATASAAEWTRDISLDLSSKGCPTALRLGVSSTANPTASSSVPAGSAATTGPSATAGQATPTAKAPNGAQRREVRARLGGIFAVLFVGSLVIIW